MADYCVSVYDILVPEKFSDHDSCTSIIKQKILSNVCE